ncbi:hypothetical protein [Herbihabitans rhizosphaerae]|uniref:hypothetical protein n=1 Tax=Herbihabitans rhizosphaerae TaxID=1872711 RepID=UPI00102ACD3F|nr:hypothetical protein [Herbihabitans rhizosphaerae]
MHEPSGSFPSGGYQGLGAFGQPEPPRRPRKWLVPVLCTVIVVAVVATVAVVLLNSQDEPRSAPPPATTSATTTVRTTTAPAPTTTRPSNPLEAPATKPAIVPGWRAVVFPNSPNAYDVPPTWEFDVGDKRMNVAYGNPELGGGQITLDVAAVTKPGYCQEKPGKVRAAAGVTAHQDSSAGAAAKAVAQKAMQIGYLSAPGAPPTTTAVSEPRPVTLTGGVQAFVVIARATKVTPPHPCLSPAGTVVVMGVPATAPATGSVLLFAHSDQGVPDAVSEADLEKIVTSYRRG